MGAGQRPHLRTVFATFAIKLCIAFSLSTLVNHLRKVLEALQQLHKDSCYGQALIEVS